MRRSSVLPQLDHPSPTPTPLPGRPRAPNALIKVSSTETQFLEAYTNSRQVAEKKAFPSKLFVVVLKFVLIRLPFSSSSRRRLSRPFVFNNIFIFHFLLFIFIFIFIFVFNYSSSSWPGPQARLNRLLSSPCRVSSPFAGGPATTENPRSPPIPSDCSLSRWRRSFTRRSPRLEGALVSRQRSEEPPPSNPPKDWKEFSFLTVVESCSLSICSGCVRVAEEERSRVLVPTGSGERGGEQKEQQSLKTG